ncbi:uncharacterized protein LOC111829467 [Capsella rubella]|uniref:uncharacterized protein LOC111829467 n=1 Tax=Capsella rubella TaxID=81985 RepID=UPI000CD4C389|nr:uncharacterized protein LOC111829467 [Capsella rubella]
MEKSQQYVAITKPFKLDPEHYGFWKVQLRQDIQSADLDAWIAVEDGWTAPVKTNEAGDAVSKPKKDWTAEEKLAAKHNATALSLIFKSLPVNQFTRVQGCESAKEAWDILQVTFEGTSNVKRTRLDILASDFENLTMGDSETIEEFSSKLSNISQEAIVLGKRYKDKKLVKKFLRSLPEKFQPHRSAIDVSLNSDELKFDQVVGMMQESADDDKVGMLVRKYFKRMERGQQRGSAVNNRSGQQKEFKRNDKSEKQCIECEGYGHYKAECPNMKKKNALKCYECKGYGHTKAECLGRDCKEKSYVTWSDESFGVTAQDDVNQVVGDESEDDEANLPTEEQVALLIRSLMSKTKEISDLTTVRNELKLKVSKISKDLEAEKVKSQGLERQLEDQLRNIKMLSKGTKDLDKLLTVGRTANVNWGLGYQGGNFNGTTKFVKAAPQSSEATQSKSVPQKNQRRAVSSFNQEQSAHVRKSRMASHEQVQSAYGSVFRLHRSRKTGCWYCGNLNHYKAQCSGFLNRVSAMMQHQQYHRDSKNTSRIYIRKEDMYCIVAYTADEQDSTQEKWFQQAELLLEMVQKEKSKEKANLISISQLCDEGLNVTFTKANCKAVDRLGRVQLEGQRSGNNCYMWSSGNPCFQAAVDFQTELWHKKLGHLNVRTMLRLAHQEVVRGMQKLKADPYFVCVPCNKGKQVKVAHKSVPDVRAVHALELVHMDLMGPMRVQSLTSKRFILVMVDDFTRYTWVRFQREKSDTLDSFRILALQLKSEKWGIKTVRSDHGGDFQNELFDQFCAAQGITHQYSAPRTPQQNGVVERKNRTLQKLLELCCMDQLGKFDSRSDEGMFLGYSGNSTAYRVYNKRSRMVQETVNVVFDDASFRVYEDVSSVTNAPKDFNEGVVGYEPSPEQEVDDGSDADDDTAELLPTPQVHKNHTSNDIIGTIQGGRVTRGKKIDFKQLAGQKQKNVAAEVPQMAAVVQFACFVSTLEPKNHRDALVDEYWIAAMQDELEQFERSDVWELKQRPADVNVVGTKWIFKNKSDAHGCIVRNKMDVKSAFLNGILQEEVYVEQPKGFENPQRPDHVYKIKKALYGLKQAPRAWYERLTTFLIKQGYIYVDDIVFGSTCQPLVDQFVKNMTQEFEMSMLKQSADGIFVSQSTYANNLVERFGLAKSKEAKVPMSVTDKLSKDEAGEDVDERVYRGMIGSLLYLTTSRPDICLSVGICARYQAKPKKSHLLAVKKIIKYIKGTVNLGIYYTKDTTRSLTGYCDADWAGSLDDRISTSGGCFFMGNNLISWHSKKQNSVSLSTAEAEYIALGSCCTQLMWMKQMAADYNMDSETLLIHCDNQSAINIAKNPVQHSRTKHIDIRHHFIRELVEAKLIVVDHLELKVCQSERLATELRADLSKIQKVVVAFSSVLNKWLAQNTDERETQADTSLPEQPSPPKEDQVTDPQRSESPAPNTQLVPYTVIFPESETQEIEPLAISNSPVDVDGDCDSSAHPRVSQPTDANEPVRNPQI